MKNYPPKVSLSAAWSITGGDYRRLPKAAWKRFFQGLGEGVTGFSCGICEEGFSGSAEDAQMQQIERGAAVYGAFSEHYGISPADAAFLLKERARLKIF